LIRQSRLQVGSASTRYLATDGPDDRPPVLFVHGNPGSADDWRPFMTKLDGRRRCLAPDMLGWGHSDRVPGFEHTMANLARFFEDWIDAVGVADFDIVVHDWGIIGLVAAARRPQPTGRVAVIGCVPLTGEYRWHLAARLWRRRGVGELLNATNTRWALQQILRPAIHNDAARKQLAKDIMRDMDPGMKRAILELYRDADPERMTEFGKELGRLGGPSLVIWGKDDPYLPYKFCADFYGKVLDGRVEHFDRSGHWPWLDRPEVVDTVADFLEA